MLALEEVGSSLTRAKKWGDELFGGATMHTTALYLKTNSWGEGGVLRAAEGF